MSRAAPPPTVVASRDLRPTWAARCGDSDAAGIKCGMSVSLVPPLLSFENSFARELDGLYVPWQPAPPRTPQLLALNDDLVAELGLDPDALRDLAGVELLSGRVVPEGAAPLAQAYSGHQFGMYAPLLGDGRALLLGEVVDVHGRRRDLHMKGSGRTPFA